MNHEGKEPHENQKRPFPSPMLLREAAMDHQIPKEQLDACPWTVFAPEAIVYAQADQQSKKMGPLPVKKEVQGRLFITPDNNIEWLEIEFEGNTAYLLRASVTRLHPVNKVSKDIPIGTEFVNRWWGLPLEYEPSDLAAVPQEHGYEKDRVYRLRKPAVDSLIEMFEAAKEDELPLLICSDYRSGPRQRDIYLEAIAKDGPEQRYSAPPGHSEHQLGTTADIVDGAGEFPWSQDMDKTPEGKWLEKNAPKFGWIRSYYPENQEETGYISEPWHWRYIGKV